MGVTGVSVCYNLGKQFEMLGFLYDLMLGGFDSLNTSLVANMVRVQTKELLVAIRERLGFLYSDNVHINTGVVSSP